MQRGDSRMSESVRALSELHYVDFGGPDVFRRLLRRHGLEYAQTERYGLDLGELGTAPSGWHIWCGDGLHLLTACDPLDGEHTGPAEGHAGYASYVKVEGEMPEVEGLYRDVIETAAGIKGEFRPLTTSDGRVVAENWRGRDGL